MWTGISGEAVFEGRVQARLPGVFRGGFLHLQCGFPPAKLKGGDVVIKPGLFVLQMPANPRLRDAGEAGEGLPDSLTQPGPAEAHGEPFGEAEHVPQRRTHCLIDGTLHVGSIPEVELCQVAVSPGAMVLITGGGKGSPSSGHTISPSRRDRVLVGGAGPKARDPDEGVVIALY